MTPEVEAARLAWLVAQSHWWDCSERDRRMAQEFMVEPYYSLETITAHFIATGLYIHYLRLRDEVEREAVAKAEEFIASLKALESLRGHTEEELDAITQGLMNIAGEVKP